jgi:hypothetical protein
MGICQFCGKGFHKYRGNHKFCSASCRVRACQKAARTIILEVWTEGEVPLVRDAVLAGSVNGRPMDVAVVVRGTVR